MARRNISMLRVGRCMAFVAAAALLLPFTIILMLADQQYLQGYTYSKRLFYQESDYFRNNGSYNDTVYADSSLVWLRNQYVLENSTHEEGLLSREKFLEANRRMDLRREYLKEQCRALGFEKSSYKPYSWEFLINRQYHVIWCNIFKAASTSWMYNFNIMANYTADFLKKTAAVPLALARKKYIRPSVEMLKKAQFDSITFLIVRHPFERLASAYNDKIAHAWPRTFHEHMGHKIVKKYRKKNTHEKRPLFEEFVDYVIDEHKGNRTLDMHWTPITDFCTPCKFNFDVVLKFETLDEDQKYLIQLAQLQNVIKPEWKNTGKAKSGNFVNQFFSRLNRKQLDGLYTLYQNDFLLFNYTITDYYKLVDARNHD